MSAISYKTEVFEGPMDLLLHLITKHKINIYDIPIIELVEQYTSYIREMQELNLELASEFLEMAARLVHIKALSLLPVYNESAQLTRELSGELIEYAECKRIARTLSENTRGFDCLSRPQAHIESDMTYTRIHDSIELLNAYMRAVGNRMRKIPPTIDSFKTIITRKIVSVSYKIKNIVSQLSSCGKCSFYDILLSCESRSDMVASFLAILELAKTKHVHLEGDGQSITVELIKVPEGELDFD